MCGCSKWNTDLSITIPLVLRTFPALGPPQLVMGPWLAQVPDTWPSASGHYKVAACNTQTLTASANISPSYPIFTSYHTACLSRHDAGRPRREAQPMHALLGELQVMDRLPISGGKHLNPPRSASRRGRRRAKRPCSLSSRRL